MGTIVDRVSQIVDLLWDKKVSTAKKIILADKMAVHFMPDYTPEKYAQLTNEQKADVVASGIRSMLLNVVGSGGGKVAEIDAAKLVANAIEDAKNAFDPDQD